MIRPAVECVGLWSLAVIRPAVECVGLWSLAVIRPAVECVGLWLLAVIGPAAWESRLTQVHHSPGGWWGYGQTCSGQRYSEHPVKWTPLIMVFHYNWNVCSRVNCNATPI